jgi:hypothetical protein
LKSFKIEDQIKPVPNVLSWDGYWFSLTGLTSAITKMLKVDVKSTIATALVDNGPNSDY